MQQFANVRSCALLVIAAAAVPGRRLWLLSFHNFISTYYAPLLFRPLSYLRGLRALFGERKLVLAV
jgi:hypothetical protein